MQPGVAHATQVAMMVPTTKVTSMVDASMWTDTWDHADDDNDKPQAMATWDIHLATSSRVSSMQATSSKTSTTPSSGWGYHPRNHDAWTSWPPQMSSPKETKKTDVDTAPKE